MKKILLTLSILTMSANVFGMQPVNIQQLIDAKNALTGESRLIEWLGRNEGETSYIVSNLDPPATNIQNIKVNFDTQTGKISRIFITTARIRTEYRADQLRESAEGKELIKKIKGTPKAQ